MSQEILVNVTAKEVRVALLEEGVLQEVHIERSFHQGLLGNIYKGKVSRLMPGIQAAFIDIGLDRAAFLHVSDMGVDAKIATAAETYSHVDIRTLLKQGQELLVQVYKEPLGSKGARLTTQFTMPSRYLVLTPDVFQVVVSQRIVDENIRQQLQDKITPSEQGGFIFRTIAENASLSELEADKQFLNTLWAEVKAQTKTVKTPGLVYTEIPMVLRVLRDLVGLNAKTIYVDDASAVSQMQAYAERYVPNLVSSIRLYEGTSSLFDAYGVENELRKALERVVPLASGGHVVIDQTEAMTTIDVNTGSFLDNQNIEQTLLKTNVEAAETIARQVRLRNLGGIIIIDFIDMHNPAHKAQLLEAFNTALSRDRSKVQVSELSSLGLVQMTRKRTRESLEHVLCIPCPVCKKRGSIKSIATVCYEIFREIRRLSEQHRWPGFIIVAANSIIDTLQNAESAMLADLQTHLAKPIQLRAELSYVQEHYEILALSPKE